MEKDEKKRIHKALMSSEPMHTYKISTVTNLFMLGSIGFIIATFLQSTKTSITVYFLFGGISIIIAGFLNFIQIEQPGRFLRFIEYILLWIGMSLYFVAAIALLMLQILTLK